MAHDVVHLHSWAQFKEIVPSRLFPTVPFQRGVFLFRGHGSAQWPLMSAFDRWYNRGDRALKGSAADRLIELFRKEAEGTAVDGNVWDDPLRTLSLAQHHGIPTRLLDWTESPYVAAFFAFAGIGLVAEPEDFVAVWALDTRNPIWSREYGVELLEVPTQGNERLRTQLGRHSLLRAPFDTLEEYVAHFPDQSAALIQFVVPSSEASMALAELDIMGINYSRIFPGLEGCARAARLRMSLER